jgi:uncharacterized protein YbaP (TraB family)
MKTIIALGFTALLSFTSIAKSQNKNTENNKSLLWEVSGNGLSKPSYIMGTFHTLCSKDFEMKPKVLKALENSDNLVLEINYTDPNETAAMQKMFQADKKITEQLSSDEAKELDKILLKYGTTLKNVDNYSQQALYSLLATKATPCPMTEVKMYEVELLKNAMKNKKKIKGLEKVADQLSSINKAYDLKNAIAQLKMGDEYAVYLQKVIETFKNEDLPALNKLMKDKRFMNKQQEEIIVTKRNKNWAEKMPEMMKSENSFFAVGGAHLWGDNGLINLLKIKGYTVKPISSL